MPRSPKYHYDKDQVFYDSNKESCIVPHELITELQQLANRWGNFRCRQEHPPGTRAIFIQKRLEFHPLTLSFTLRAPSYRKPKPVRWLLFYQFIRHQREIHEWLIHHFPVRSRDAFDEQITRWLEHVRDAKLLWNDYPSALAKDEVWAYFDRRDPRYRIVVRPPKDPNVIPPLTSLHDVYMNLQLLRALPRETLQRGGYNYDSPNR